MSFEKYNITNVGGVSSDSETVLHLYGDVAAVYQLQHPVIVNKYVHLEMTVQSLVEVENVRICLYESNEDVMSEKELVGEEYRCSDILTSNADIHIGDLFDDRSTSISFLRFEQLNSDNPLSGSTIISDLSFVKREAIGVFNADNSCVDQKSSKIITSDGDSQCLCNTGYVSSNGGKTLRAHDSCVSCLPKNSCAFDGDPCTLDRHCAMGTCKNDFCVAGVSCLFMIVMLNFEPFTSISRQNT